MTDVKTQTQVNVTSKPEGFTMIKTWQLVVGFIVMVLTFGIQVGYGAFYITTVTKEQDVMNSRIVKLETEAEKKEQTDREMLRLLQEVNLNLQISMEKQGLTYKEVPKGN